MARREITVFGGSGFVGRYVIKELAQAGWVIRVPTRYMRGAQFLRPLGNPGQIVLFPFSAREPETIAQSLQGVDAAVNLIGILYEKRKSRFSAIHRDLAAEIAKTAKEKGVTRLVHMSALGADPVSPSAYARSKAEGEEAVEAAFPGVTTFRPSLIFGPEDEFFNRFAHLARLFPALPLIGGGQSRFQPVYVGDVARAFRSALDHHETKGTIFELGGPHVYRFEELLKLILAETHRHRPLIPLPWFLASIAAAILQWWPKPLLTIDQLRLLRRDNIASGGFPGLAALGIAPTLLEAILPTYLERYRPGGYQPTKRPPR